MSAPGRTPPGNLGEFPVDDSTIACVLHALGGAYRVDGDGEHVLVGADYSLHDLLDFMSGAYDPPGLAPEDNPALVPEPHGWTDLRPHFSHHDLIRALCEEVLRLRGNQGTVEP